MALANAWTEQYQPEIQTRPELTVLEGGSATLRVGASIAERRRRRQALLRRRRRAIAVAVAVLASVLLAWPGHAFGGVMHDGALTDAASSSTLSPGSVYVVQSGDSLTTIARLIAPTNVAAARRALIASLGTSYVIAGERVLIP